MLGTMRLQEWIHRLEVGVGARYLRWLLAVFGFIALAALYDAFCFHNLNDPAAMDAAQLARNIGRGRGYTTDYVRPFSISLTRSHRADRSSQLKEAHRDISNAPVYPLLLAPLLRWAPAPGEVASIKNFSVVSGDLAIALLNQALLGLGALLVFRLTRGWFDQTVAWVCAVLFVFTELYWQFSVSGLSTLLLIDLVLLLVSFLAAFERGNREEAKTSRLILLAAAIGASTAILMLTRYSLGWLLVPVLIFVIACGTRGRVGFALVAFATFLILGVPWIVRNVMASGAPFGTATYAPLADTFVFPDEMLDRSLNPQFRGLPGHRWTLVSAVGQKAVTGVREIITTELPRAGGNWLWAFFLAGLLVRFQNPNLSRMRWFLLGALFLLVPVQAMARTHLSADASQVNSENLLVIFSPLVLVFGVGLFFILFDSWPLPTPAMRVGMLLIFIAIISLPMLLAFVPPRPRPIAPPYYPPRIQQVARYLNRSELLMSDIPWAVAWYGDRQCVGITSDWRKEFFEINDYEKTVNGLYLSTRTTDSKFFSSWFGGDNRGWGVFLFQAFARGEVPQGFPLKRSPEGLFTNGEVLLMDRDRWSAAAGAKKF